MDLDIIAIVVSIIAIVVSVITFVSQKQQDKKLNTINLEAEYFSDIYKEHLIKNIPNARRYIAFVQGKLSGTQKMIDVLKAIQQDSYYYCYKEPEFYEKMQKKVQDFEDYLSSNTGHSYTGEQQTEVLLKIKIYIEEIYDCICNHLVGN
ncbi:MAG: hypothetical protein Q4D45_10530 [Lachnospiraceae bacterium]|nr:hypothetical protein [Lachnospiraceae bacterium]